MQTLDVATPLKDEFTTELFNVLPPSLARNGRIQFCSPAGTDAVEAALKLAAAATGNSGVLAFTGAYHGMTAGALNASADVATKTTARATSIDIARFPFPYEYRCPFGIGGKQTAKISEHLVGSVLSDPKGGIRPPAAMIFEAIQGEGGVIVAPDSWVRGMRSITKTHGIPLIADEVQTGVGRTGQMWAVDHSGVVPDIMVISKAVGGGLPLAVVVYHEDLDTWGRGSHAGTFRGSQLSFAAGLATLRIIQECDLSSRSQTLGNRIMRALKEIAVTHSCVGDIRGRGLMIGIEFVSGAENVVGQGVAPPPSPMLANFVRGECLRRGLIVELGGRGDSVLRLLPPLTMSDEESESVVERLADAIAAAEKKFAGGSNVN